MKTMLFSFVALVIFVGAQAFAADASIEVGMRSQSGSVDSTTSSTSSQTGFQVGGVGAFEINGPLYFRTGLLYTQRPLTVTTPSVADNKVNLNYVDIPLTLLYKFEDYAGVYGGVILASNLDSSCSGTCTKVDGVKSMYVPFVIGAAFKFAPQLGASIYFESGSGEVATGLKDYKAVGANLAITFE